MELLAYLFAALPFVIALLIALGTVALVWGLATSPAAGAAWVLFASLLQAAFVFVPSINLGINIFVGDLVSVLLGMALVIRGARYPWASAIGRAWLVFGIFMIASFLLGVARFGAGRAGSDFRTYFFYFWTGVAYFLTFEMSPAQLRRIRSVFICAALLIVSLACIRWVAELGDISLGAFGAAFRDGKRFRVVSAGQTVIIAVGALFLLQRWLTRESGFGAAALAMLMLLAVMVLQHRSAWGAVVLGLAGLIALQRKQLGRSGGAALWVVLGVVAVLVPLLLLGLGGDVQQSVGGSVQEAVSDRSTFVGRIEGWRSLLAEWSASGVRSYAIGQPFGSGYLREQQGTMVSWTPHNYYVHVLVRTGVIGLLALLFVFVLAGVRLFAARSGGLAPWVPILVAFLMLELAYFVPYSANFEQAIYCGMALAVAARLAPKVVSQARGSVTLDRSAAWQTRPGADRQGQA